MSKILIIDDKIDNLITINAVLKILLPESELITCLSGAEGIEKMRLDKPDMVLCDVQMPGMDGFEVIRLTKSDDVLKHIPIVLITATKTTSEDRAKGLKLGAATFISKPIDEVELIARIKVTLRIKEYEDLLRKEKEYLKEMVQEKTEHLKQSLDKLEIMLDGIINTLITVVEMRDPYTAGHQNKVAEYSCAIAEQMQLSEKEIETIRMAAVLHDIGKISIPSEILSKPGKLTELEYAMLKEHPESGYNILKEIEFEAPIAEIVYQHHERIDGTGYPRHLKDDEILIEAKIICVADVLEAITSHRPYRAALGLVIALEELKGNRGKIYDADVVDACIEVIKVNGLRDLQ